MSSHISQRAKNIVRMTMADMANLADARTEAFRLENADTNLTPPAHVLEATRRAVGIDRYNSYLPLHGLRELREAIVRRYHEDSGMRYDAEGEVVITSGAGEAMLSTLLALVNPGEKVLLTNPTYSGMAQRVRLANGVQVFTNLQEEEGWHLDLEDLQQKAAGCKVIFYISPSMPTGAVFTEEETRVIAETAQKNDAVIVFNASLDKIVYDGRRTVNPAGLKDMKDRTITIGSVSKNYNMIGWRVGWAVGPHNLIKAIENVHIFNGIMPSGITQAGATAALNGPQEWVEEAVKVYQKRRDILAEALEKIPGISLVKPEGGYYFIVNIRKLGVKSPEFCTRLLEEKNVAATPMVAWGSDDFGLEHVRFIFTNESEEGLQKAGKLIQEFIQENYRN